jgi:hypothetical protein
MGFRRKQTSLAAAVILTLQSSPAWSQERLPSDAISTRENDVVNPAQPPMPLLPAPSLPAPSLPAPSLTPPVTLPEPTPAEARVSREAKKASVDVPCVCPECLPAPQKQERYSGHVLLADGATLVLATVGGVIAGNGAPAGETLLALAAGTYALVPPIIHWSRGNVGKGFGSLGLRLGVPVVSGLGLGFLGAIAVGAVSDFSRLGVAYGGFFGGSIGAGLGAITAMVLDASMLAKEDVDPLATDLKTAKRKPSLLTIRPSATWERGGGKLLLGGTF